MNTRSLHQSLERIGLPWMTVLAIALASSLIYLVPALWQTWTHDGPTLVTPGGFVTGHDFIAFYAAAQAALAGDGALVYDRQFMMTAQAELVGTFDIGYLAFMYPPTYLFLLSPLAALPYFPALALWQAIPLIAFLVLLRRLALPSAALILAVGAPAVAQTLFAGQNGLLFASFLGGGLLLLDRRPALAGLLLGFTAAKPQLAILLLPALIAGRKWRALATMMGSIGVIVLLSTGAFGADIWLSFLNMSLDARHYLALGQLPWSRMPTVYTAIRLAGFPDTVATVMQLAATLSVVAGIVLIWRREVPAGLRIAVLLAGVPLSTPFLYDYDLPFMLIALGLYLVEALRGDALSWEKVVLLLVWLQPVWWWHWLTESSGVSIAPLVYALLFITVIRRARMTAVVSTPAVGQ